MKRKSFAMIFRGFFFLIVCWGLNLSGQAKLAAAEPSGSSFDSRNSSTLAPLTLEKCIELTLNNNQEILGAGHGVSAAEAQLNEAQANFWPVLDYQYRAAPIPENVDDAVHSFFSGDVTMSNSISLKLGMPITGFGQLRLAQQLAQVGVTASRQKLHKTAADKTLEVKKLYYGLQFAHQAASVANDALAKLNQKIREDEKKEIPEISPLDMAQLKLFRLELMKRQAEIRSNTELAEQGLRVQMGLPDDYPIKLASYNLSPKAAQLSSFEAYFGTKTPKQLDAQLLQTGVEAKRKQYELEKSKLRPRLGVGAFLEAGKTVSEISGLDAQDDFSDPFNYKRAGIGLQLEGKLDFHGAFARIRRTEAEYFKASIEQKIAERGLNLRAQKAFLQTQRAKAEVERAQEFNKLARQMTFLSKSNLDLGVGDQKTYAESLKTVLLGKAAYLEAVFNYNVALAELEQLTMQ